MDHPHPLRRYGYNHQSIQAGEGPQGHCGCPANEAKRLPQVPAVQGERGLRRAGQSPGTAKPPDHSPGNGRRSLVLAVFALRLL